MDESVLRWWELLHLIVLINMILLGTVFYLLQKRKSVLSDTVFYYRKCHFFLTSLYVLGCGFRSILPRGDIRRIVLYDHPLSAIVFGRTAATIAELSFVAQWCLLLYELGKYTKNKTIQSLAKWPLILIFIAECFSWYACLTTNYLGTAIEESLWAVSAFITIYGFYLALPFYKSVQKRFLQSGIVLGFLYILYMVFVDVPAYVSGWRAAEAANKTYLSIAEGWSEVCNQLNLTTSYQDWQYEMVWMTLYFSIAVWISLSLVLTPSLEKTVGADLRVHPRID